jgi:hypothetical protein
MPHSINHGDACFAYVNKIWGIPQEGRSLIFADFTAIARERLAVIVCEQNS